MQQKELAKTDLHLQKFGDAVQQLLVALDVQLKFIKFRYQLGLSATLVATEKDNHTTRSPRVENLLLGTPMPEM